MVKQILRGKKRRYLILRKKNTKSNLITYFNVLGVIIQYKINKHVNTKESCIPQIWINHPNLKSNVKKSQIYQNNRHNKNLNKLKTTKQISSVHQKYNLFPTRHVALHQSNSNESSNKCSSTKDGSVTGARCRWDVGDGLTWRRSTRSGGGWWRWRNRERWWWRS